MAIKGFSIKGVAKTSGAVKPLSALAAEVERLREKTDKLDKSSRRAGDATESFGRKFGGLKGTLLAGTAALAGTVVAMDRVIERSMRLQNVQQNLPFAIEKARKATRGLIDDFELSRLAIEANRLGVAKSEEEFARMAEQATKLGLSVGKDALSSVQDLTEGLGKGSPEVLNNLGIIVRANEAYDKYAASIGKVAKELTEAEKRQAIMSEGLGQAERMSSKLNLRVDKTTESWIQLKTEMKNWADAIVPVVVGAMTAIRDEIKLAQDDLFNLLEAVTGGQTALISVRYDKNGNPIFVAPGASGTGTRGVAGAGAKPGDPGYEAIRQGQLDRERQDMIARRIDAEARAQNARINASIAPSASGSAARPRGGGGAANGPGYMGQDIQAAQDAVVGALFGVADALGTAAGQELQGIQNDRRNSRERRQELLSDIKTFNDERFAVELEAARKRDEIRQKELEAERIVAEQRMSIATAASDALIDAGGVAARAALMGQGGVREAVHSFAKSKAIEMSVLALTETARGIAAAASPITAAAAPGHFLAAGKAAAAAAAIGVIAGVTGGGGGGLGGLGGGGRNKQAESYFNKDNFGGGTGPRTQGRNAPKRGGAIVSSTSMIESQGPQRMSQQTGDVYNINVSTLGFADQEQMVGTLRKAIARHGQKIGKAV